MGGGGFLRGGGSELIVRSVAVCTCVFDGPLYWGQLDSNIAGITSAN